MDDLIAAIDAFIDEHRHQTFVPVDTVVNFALDLRTLAADLALVPA